jgi:hypothetical protein
MNASSESGLWALRISRGVCSSIQGGSEVQYLTPRLAGRDLERRDEIKKGRAALPFSMVSVLQVPA